MIWTSILAEASTTTGAMISTFPNFANVLGKISTLVVLALCLERVFAFVFEWEWVKSLLEKAPDAAKPGVMVSRIPGMKAFITALTSWIICYRNDFDLLQTLFNADDPDWVGVLVTRLVAAGGSSGAIALFQGVLGFSKEARDAQIATRQATALAEQRKAEASVTQAEADKSRAEAEKAKAEGDKVKAVLEKERAEKERPGGTSP